MRVVALLRKYLGPRPAVSSKQLTAMADSRRFKEVVEIYQKGQAGDTPAVSFVVGYCFYQLTEYEEAIVHLEKAIAGSRKNYLPRYFLAVSLKNLGRHAEAIPHLLNCLKSPERRTDEVLDHLLPLTAELSDSTERQKTFELITKLLGKLSPANPYAAKLLFYQRRENEITPEMLKGEQFSRFYSARALTDAGRGTLLPAGPPEKLRFVNLEDNSEVWVETCLPYVAEIPDAKIISGSTLVHLDDGRILSDVLADKDYGRYANMQYDRTVIARRDDALLVKTFEPENEIAEGIMLCGLASNAYGHWFAEFLPKLRFFETHPRFPKIPIIIDEGMPQSHYDYLAALVSNPTHRLAKGSSLRVRNLLVAPADTFFPLELIINHQVPPERQSNSTIGGLRYLRAKIKERYGEVEKPTSRLFLSRRSSQWRRLVNEDAIIAELKDLNFEVVYVEDYTFEQQVRLFQNAEFIVGPNGSALNNLVFSSPKVKVLMLGQKNLFNWGGWFGSFWELGYSPRYLPCEWFGDKNQKHADYSISPSIVRNHVIEMLGT